MSDRITAVVLLVVAVAFGVQAWSYVSPGFTDVLGARAFPIAVAVFMVPLTVTLFIEGHPGTDWPNRHAWFVLLTALVALALYAVVIEPLGYFVATTAVFVVFGKLFHARWWQSLTAGVIASVVLYALFVWALDLHLPVGSVFGGD